MVPPKCASWPLVDKPNGSHHERKEGLYGNLLADNWPPKYEVMTVMGKFIINEGLPPPCYHPNEINYLPAW